MVLKIVKDLRKRALKTFMDILLLTELQKNPLSGYDIIGLVHKRYDILMSPGTIYSMLYSLERDGLVRAEMEDRKRVYNLTAKGEETLNTVSKANIKIYSLLNNLILQ